jgi:hypothetical protein
LLEDALDVFPADPVDAERGIGHRRQGRAAPEQGIDHRVRVRRLGQVVDGPGPQRHHHGREAVEPRDHHDPRRPVEPAQLLDQGKAAAVAQAHLDHGEGEGPLRRGRQRRPAAGGRGYLESAGSERITERGPAADFLVHQQ